MNYVLWYHVIISGHDPQICNQNVFVEFVILMYFIEVQISNNNNHIRILNISKSLLFFQMMKKKIQAIEVTEVLDQIVRKVKEAQDGQIILMNLKIHSFYISNKKQKKQNREMTKLKFQSRM